MKLFRTVVCSLSLVAAVACGGSSTDKKECNGGGECATECEKKECMEKSECKSAAVIDNMMSRRSIRNYKQQAVPREVLNRIMECGINAPNGQNKQSWEVRVVENPELQNEIRALMATVGGERAAGCFYNAPVWVFIARDKVYDFSAYDCGLMAENMMLAANAMGVGTVCLGSPVRYILMAEGNEQVLSKLGFSEGYELSLCISMGYPEGEKPEAKPRDMGKVKYID
ncbi:MAG: nitroreductase [Bacteroidaceae bacterium]|nr:nitroreductase [Bacteroidaceae bacterium]